MSWGFSARLVSPELRALRRDATVALRKHLKEAHGCYLSNLGRDFQDLYQWHHDHAGSCRDLPPEVPALLERWSREEAAVKAGRTAGLTDGLEQARSRR